MKIINKQNFFPIVCVIYTMLSLGKILLEAVFQRVFGDYQENLLVMFGLSLLATFVLSQHYRFQNLPLPAVIMGQYVALIGVVMAVTWISSFFQQLHEDGYWDMFLSFTIPYAIGAVAYYISLFYEIKKANEALKDIRRYQNERSDK